VLYLSQDIGGQHLGDLVEVPPLDPDAEGRRSPPEVDDAVEALDARNG
jgi:hypothetical protein